MKLLLVEDELRLSEALSYMLRKNNYIVDVANDGILAYDMALTNIYDLIILDRMLPGKDGLGILKDLRAKKISVPVIFLTAKDTIADRVEGLDYGADDYLIKPFSTEELLARIRALIRRKDTSLQSETLKIANLELNSLNCEAKISNDIVKLTLKESQLLELLMINAGQAITKEQVLDRLWDSDSIVEANNVEIYICYLRKKLNLNQANISIETVRGVGYCLKGIT